MPFQSKNILRDDYDPDDEVRPSIISSAPLYAYNFTNKCYNYSKGEWWIVAGSLTEASNFAAKLCREINCQANGNQNYTAELVFTTGRITELKAGAVIR